MSKKATDLMSVNLGQIVVSDKFHYNEDCFVKQLCIILPQMSWYIKYFEYEYVFLD